MPHSNCFHYCLQSLETLPIFWQRSPPFQPTIRFSFTTIESFLPSLWDLSPRLTSFFNIVYFVILLSLVFFGAMLSRYRLIFATVLPFLQFWWLTCSEGGLGLEWETFSSVVCSHRFALGWLGGLVPLSSPLFRMPFWHKTYWDPSSPVNFRKSFWIMIFWRQMRHLSFWRFFA